VRNSMNIIQSLNYIENPQLKHLGGKGVNLGILASAGFPVPPGFCITTDAYYQFVSANNLQELINRLMAQTHPDDPASLEETSAQIRASFEQGHIPAQISNAICQAYIALCQQSRSPEPTAVAVRSSATAEDLPDMSFAGQQDTYLNIMSEQSVLSAVIQCWGSLWTARAIGYRARNHIAQDEVSLAVVVQSMIQSEVSGVLFTANPLTGKRSETVIDASLGLGEALVSGLVEPDNYIVDTATRQISSKTIGAKKISIRGQIGGGTITQAEEAHTYQALPDQQILALADLGQQIAQRFKNPQDIEWAYAGGELYILQSRPITSLYPVPERLEGSPELKMMFSFGSVQGMLDPITPLGRDVFVLLGTATAQQFGQNVTPETQPIIYTAGERLFINFTGAFRHPTWHNIVMEFFGSIDPLVQQIFFSLESDPRLAIRKTGMRLRTRLILARRIAQMGSNVLINLLWPDWGRARLTRIIDQEIERFQAQCDSTSSMAQRLDMFIAALSALPSTLRAHLLPSVISGQAMFQPLLRLAKDLPGNQDLPMELTRGLPHNVTTEMDLTLWQVSRAIQADPASAEHFRCTEAAQLAQEYLAGTLPSTAQTAVKDFLHQYGMRGLAEIDLGRPRWREDPTQIMQVLGSYLKIEDEALSPQAVFARGALHAAAAREQLIAAFRQTERGWIKSRIAAFASHRVRALGGLRETPKFTAIRVMGIWREALMQDGKRLVERGILTQPDDVVYLHLKELKQLAAGEERDWNALVASRRQIYAREKRRKQIPRLLLSDGTAYYQSFSEHAASGDQMITGSPVSPGIVEGTAHVLLDPRGAQLAPGEILVCPATDPGWTPLFLAAGGLVMEVGGMMTHGSVVAREYGIPAVVGVPHATTRIKTGQRLRVDGSNGEA
jgi:rifampicin phosphotransferase